MVPRGYGKLSLVTNAAFIAYLWSEMLELWQGGMLQIPDGVTVVFADNGGGIIQGLNDVSVGDGLYYHISCRANQLSEKISVATIFQEMTAFLAKAKNKDAKRPTIFILNGSDLKPYLLSLPAAFALAWNPSIATAATDPTVGGSRGAGGSVVQQTTPAAAYVHAWAAAHYGSAPALKVAEVYASFLETQSGASFGSDYGVLIDVTNLLDDMDALLNLGRNFSSLHAEATAMATGADLQTKALLPLLPVATDVLDSLDARVKPAYTSHLLAQLHLLANATQAISNVASVALAIDPHAAAAHAGINAAIQSVGGCLAALRMAEGGATGNRWRGMYAHDRLDDYQHLRRRILLLQSHLPSTVAQSPVYLRPLCSCTGGFHNCSGSVPYADCPDLFDYQLAPNYDPTAFPLLYHRAARTSKQRTARDIVAGDHSNHGSNHGVSGGDNGASTASAIGGPFAGVVRGGCTGSGCETTPAGGVVSDANNATVWLGLASGMAGTIRYTLDGSDPASTTGAVYLHPFQFHAVIGRSTRFASPSATATGTVMVVNAKVFNVTATAGRAGLSVSVDARTPVSTFKYFKV